MNDVTGAETCEWCGRAIPKSTNATNTIDKPSVNWVNTRTSDHINRTGGLHSFHRFPLPKGKNK